MTEFHTYAIAGRVGRKKEFPERITLPMAEGTTARVGAVVREGEVRLDVIREAIERELKRREREKPKD